MCWQWAMCLRMRLTWPMAVAMRTRILTVVSHCGGGSFKSQIKKADKSGASIAVIIGESELANKQATIKFLREDREQEQVSFDKLARFLGECI